MNKRLKLEQELVDMFLSTIKRQAKNMEGVSVSIVQIETGATSLGVPDLLMFLTSKTMSKTVWLECKRLESKFEVTAGNDRAVSMTGSVHLRPGQMRMLHKLRNHGQSAYIVVITQSQDICLLDPMDYPIETEHLKLNNNYGVVLPYTLQYLIKQIT